MATRPDGLIKDILLNEIKLAKFNLHYKQQATKQGRWKGLRYFGFQEANAALTEAGLIVGVSQRASHFQHNEYKHLKFNKLETGNILGGVGQTIGAGGSAIEFAINGYHFLDAHHKGFGGGTAIKYVAEVDGKIEQELADLNKLADTEEPGIRQIHQKEAKVLADVHDLLISEFRGFHIAARRALWFQQSFYLIDIAKNVTGAVGNYYGFKALQKRHRRYNRQASVLVTTSGILIIGAPIVSRLIGYGAAVADRYSLNKAKLESTETHLSHLTEDLNSLQAALKSGGEGDAVSAALSRSALYETHQDRLTKQINLSAREVQSGNSIAIQNLVSGMLVGGTKLANGITFMEAGYRWYNSPKQTNFLIGAGSIPYMVGAAYAVGDNVRIQVSRELKYHKLKEQHQLPGQIIKDELSELDSLETQVNNARF